MARKNRGIQKLEPVPLTLTFALPSGEAGIPTIGYIDLSQSASLASRKFLRQGLNWGFAGMKIVSAVPGTFSVYKLPQTWTMSNAWHKSFAVWSRMNNDALEEAESVRPRFLDFKIFADATHHAAGFAANLLPQSPSGVTMGGEWESSKIFHPVGVGAVEGATHEAELIAVGANWPGPGASGLNAASLIEGYAASRGLPNVLDPNTPDDAFDTDNFTPENWMAAIFNEGTEQTSDVIAELTSENNIAPYPFEHGNDSNQFLPSGAPNPNWNLPFVDTMYPGGANQMEGLQWHDFTQIYSTSGTTNVGIARVKGGNVPCGLLKVAWIPSSAPGNQLLIQIDMIPGNHRGYLAEPMQDM